MSSLIEELQQAGCGLPLARDAKAASDRRCHVLRAMRVPAVALCAVVPMAVSEPELDRDPQDGDDDRGDP
jgi:hypothetical protein